MLVGGNFTSFKCLRKRCQPGADINIIDIKGQSNTTISPEVRVPESDEG